MALVHRSRGLAGNPATIKAMIEGLTSEKRADDQK